MKNQIIRWSILVLTMCIKLQASCLSVAIPEQLVNQNATLLLYMVDGSGKQSVGKCHLDQNCRFRAILQRELEITSSDVADVLPVSMDLLKSDVAAESAVVICFELDMQVQVFRILVVKSTLLEEDPFDVVSLLVHESVGLHELYADMAYDELSSLAQTVEQQQDAVTAQYKNNPAWFEQYMLYAKIFMLMQYNKAQRAMRNVSSWWN